MHFEQHVVFVLDSAASAPKHQNQNQSIWRFFMAKRKSTPPQARSGTAAPARRGFSPPPWGLILMLVGAVLLLIPLFLVLRGGSGAPRMEVDQEVIDFGPVKMGEPVTATFTLTNTGSAPLRFSRAPWIELKEGC
jgi:hypothetical protein